MNDSISTGKTMNLKTLILTGILGTAMAAQGALVFQMDFNDESGNQSLLDRGTTGVTGSPCVPPADATGDGVVGVDDLLAVILEWGCVTPPGACAADLTADGVVDADDLALVLADWGAGAGACCLTDGTCMVIAAAACDETGGSYRGDATACADRCTDGACCVAGDCGSVGGGPACTGATPNACRPRAAA